MPWNTAAVERHIAGVPEVPRSVAITIRPALSEDAEAIACAFVESAEAHSAFDPNRYEPPAADAIAARYRAGAQHPPEAQAITLVAEFNGKIVGFVDARVERSPDPMHRPIVYCHIAEIAVRHVHRSQGVGQRLLRAAEEWGQRSGAQFALLEYHVANTRAGDFYQRMGYVVASMTVIRWLSSSSAHPDPHTATAPDPRNR